ncbi:MAG TPA: hypothetical protein VEC06_10055 [Paucimonas sp.]|nr:hypothetical protein [Paucimonas sp.]
MHPISTFATSRSRSLRAIARKIVIHALLLCMTAAGTIVYVYLTDETLKSAAPVLADKHGTPIPQVVIVAKRLSPAEKNEAALAAAATESEQQFRNP